VSSIPSVDRPPDAGGVAAGSVDRRADAAHAARSGLTQILTMLGNGLLPLHRMLVSRLFGQTAYGIYRTGADACEVLVRAGMAGCDKAMLRFVALHRIAGETREEAEALGSGLRLAGGILSLLALGLAAAAPWLARVWGNGAFRFVLPVLSPSIVAAGLVIVLMAATLAAKVTRVNLLVRGTAEPLLLVAATLLAWALHPTIGALAVAHASAYVALATLAWIGTSVVLGRGRLGAALRARGHPGLARFALPIGASELMNGILQRANIFILSAFAGAPAVAVFAASEELGRSVAGIRYAFDAVASPLMAESLRQRDRERLRYNLALMTRWVTSASAPIAATLLALRPQLLALYGPGYQRGATAMALLVLGHLVNGVLGLTPFVIVMSGRTKIFFWNNVGATLLNLALSLALIPRWGVTGAAVASLVSVAALQAALVVQVYIFEHVHPFDWALGKPVLAAAIALGAELIAGAVPLPAAARAALVVAVGAVVYPAALLTLRPGEEERQFVIRVMRRLVGSVRRGPP
jgi:O-antigen/teichoic acid export membrane protein